MANLENFRGDLDWIHALEDRRWAPSGPYWPGGASGITLRPGVDVGYASKAIVKKAYYDNALITASQWVSLQGAFGVKGKSAKRRLQNDRKLNTISISYEDGQDIFSFVVKDYWAGICNRFPELRRYDTPGVIQTVMLSLAYNRGIWNRALNALEDEIETKNWTQFATTIEGMQQSHPLRGIQRRRRIEGQKVKKVMRLLNKIGGLQTIKGLDPHII